MRLSTLKSLQVITTLPEMKKKSGEIRKAGKTIGFVPTMGKLHAGHMSLVRRSLATHDFTVVSIFINPAQFGPNEDLDTYPVNIEGDTNQLKEAGVDVLFFPERNSMYPEGYNSYVEIEGVTSRLCGQSRPGFFRGVATVVLKLFNIVRPHTAFFGEKDWQQLIVVKKMVRDLNLDVTITGLPIVREADGLAMSSRNQHLSGAARKSALCLSRALEWAKRQIRQGVTSATVLRSGMRDIIEQQADAKVDYISLCDPENFAAREEITSQTLIALAVFIGPVRLIDNCIAERKTCSE